MKITSVMYNEKLTRHFRNKKREYLRDRINELESNSKIKNIRDLYRGINEFKKGYQPRTN
jgi:chemotaxis methyl-accepting protein methylase